MKVCIPLSKLRFAAPVVYPQRPDHLVSSSSQPITTFNFHNPETTTDQDNATMCKLTITRYESCLRGDEHYVICAKHIEHTSLQLDNARCEDYKVSRKVLSFDIVFLDRVLIMT